MCMNDDELSMPNPAFCQRSTCMHACIPSIACHISPRCDNDMTCKVQSYNVTACPIKGDIASIIQQYDFPPAATVRSGASDALSDHTRLPKLHHPLLATSQLLPSNSPPFANHPLHQPIQLTSVHEPNFSKFAALICLPTLIRSS